MRIQILPLPTVTVGAFTETPFVIVVDEIDYEGVSESLSNALTELKALTGAVAVLTVDGGMQVGSPLELADDQIAAISARIDEALGTRPVTV